MRPEKQSSHFPVTEINEDFNLSLVGMTSMNILAVHCN